jgi:hypothetical protein
MGIAMPMLTLGIALLVVAVLVLIAALVVRNKGQKILSAPVRKTGEAAGAQGPASFEGAVRTNAPLRAPCSGQMNIGMNLKLGEAANDYKTKTKTLKPGIYTVYVWSNDKGPDKVVLGIEPAPQAEASKD